MTYKDIDTILPLVQRPSRYLGCEVNASTKAPKEAALRMVLAFPDVYEIGMAYQGLQILYQVLNRRADLAAERVFAPALDMEAQLRKRGDPLCSLESGTPLGTFDVIGFSLLYELSYTNVLAMLDLSGIPFRSADRGEGYPMVIAGGPCTFNPEPVADIFDAMVIGDGERTILDLSEAWLAWRASGLGRNDLLKRWSGLPGVYIPSFFRPAESAEGPLTVEPQVAGYSTVKKAVVEDLDGVASPSRPIVAFGNPIHDRLSLEICRGCTRGCRFCQAGMIYRPARERHPERLLALTEAALESSGYEELSLLSLSAGDYGMLPWLVGQLMNRCEPERIALSLPSLRVGSLSSSLMRQIKRVRKTGFTIAPEAGSQRLRDVINKNVDEASIFEAVRDAMALGWQGIKLYFMIGLPTETAADIEAIIDLASRLAQLGKGKKGWKGITVSVATFVPKPHTPFQWFSQISLEESRGKIATLRAGLKQRGIRFKWQHPEMSFLEGLWARGDRRLFPLLIKAFQMNCRFDGWSDSFDMASWRAAMTETGIDPYRYLKGRDVSAPLPWGHIDSGVSIPFLRSEWEKSLSATPTPDCRSGTCNKCGVCDFETVRPVVYHETETKLTAEPVARPNPPPVYKKWVVSYEKMGVSRFFGHLELAKIFARAFRRAKIPVKHSQGFHPTPKISFQTALPVGVESKEEFFSVEIPPWVTDRALMDGLNRQLTDGLSLTGCWSGTGVGRWDGPTVHRYLVALREAVFSPDRIAEFERRSAWTVEKKNRKGRVSEMDLKGLVTGLTLVSAEVLEMTMDTSGPARLPVTRVLKEIFDLSETALKLARIVKCPHVPSLSEAGLPDDEILEKGRFVKRDAIPSQK